MHCLQNKWVFFVPSNPTLLHQPAILLKRKKKDHEATQISVKISSECYTFMCLLEQIVVMMMMKDLMGSNVYSCSGSWRNLSARILNRNGILLGSFMILLMIICNSPFLAYLSYLSARVHSARLFKFHGTRLARGQSPTPRNAISKPPTQCSWENLTQMDCTRCLLSARMWGIKRS